MTFYGKFVNNKEIKSVSNKFRAENFDIFKIDCDGKI